MIEIKQIKKVDTPTVEAFSRLIPQLSPDCKAPGRDYLERIANLENTYLFAAYNPDLVGTLSLVVMEIPTGKKAWIEDVVVDSNARGQRIGEQLVRFTMEFAKEIGITSLNLTSMPERIAANNLYAKLGFVKRETNVYRLKLED